MTQLDKARQFQALHEGEGPFLIANAWDPGSARFLECLGFPAIATTSAGFAQTLGRNDGEISLEEKLAHCRSLCAVTDLPVSADLENGFGHSPGSVATAIQQAAATGLVGGSIEDYSGDEETPIYDFSLAVERVQAAVEAAQTLAFPFLVTARAENQLRQQNDLGDTVRRLQAFEEAGADVLYAPGLTSLEEVKVVTSSLRKPVNVLATMLPGITLEQLAEVGAKRISVGAALARASVTPLLRAGREMLEKGTFEWLEELPPGDFVSRALARR